MVIQPNRSEINIDDVEEQLDELTRGRAAAQQQNHSSSVKRDRGRLVKTSDVTSSGGDTSNSSSGGAGSADSSTVSGGGLVVMDNSVMAFDDFRDLPSDKQSEEIFKLLSMLSPFASEVYNAAHTHSQKAGY